MNQPTLLLRFPILLFGALSFSLLQAQVDFDWNSTVDGDWDVAANWNPDTDFPDGQGLHVRLNDSNAFAGSDTGIRTITLDTTATVGVLQFSVSSTRAIDIAGDGLLIFDNGTDPVSIPVGFASSGGNDSFLAVDIRFDTHEAIIPSRRLSISGAITAGAAFNPIVKVEGDHLRL